MEENKSQAPSQNNNKQGSKQQSLPPVKSLFTDSFYLLKKVFAPFLVFNILTFVASITAFILMGAGFLLLGLGLGIGSGFFSESASALTTFFTLGISALSMLIVFVILMIVIGSISQIGSIIILNEQNPNISVFSVIKRSFKYILPIILAGIVTNLLIFGGILLFVIPGIAFALLFIFVNYVIIAENKGAIKGIKRSVYIVKNNFSGFFLRLLSIWGVIILFTILLSTLQSGFERAGQMTGLIVLLSIIAQILMSWYVTSYIVLLYKQLKNLSPEGEGSLKVVVIISMIGWMLAIIAGFMLIRALPGFISELQEDIKQNQQQNMTPEDEQELDKIMEDIEDFETDNVNRTQDGTNSTELETSTPRETPAPTPAPTEFSLPEETPAPTPAPTSQTF